MSQSIATQTILLTFAALSTAATCALAAPLDDAGDASDIVHLSRYEVTDSKQGAYNPPETRTGLKIDAPLRDVPQTINVIPASLLRDQGARSLQDALRNSPGVGFSNGDGQRDQVTIRGFSAMTDQFVDGVRDDALYFRDLANVEMVEVVKGPAAVLYGRGSSGGLINRITKKPLTEAFHEITLRAASYDSYRVEADLNQPLSGNLQARLVAAWEDGHTFREQSFVERTFVAPSVAYTVSKATTLLFQAENLQDKRINDFGIPAINGRPANVPIETYYGSANASDDDSVTSKVSAGTFTLDHRLTDHSRLKSTLRGSKYSLDRYNTVVTAVSTAAAPLLTRRNSFVLRDEDGVFSQTDFTSDLNTGRFAHQLLVGTEFSWQDKDARSGNLATPPSTIALYNPVLTSLGTKVYTTSANSTGVSKVAALYGQDLVTLSAHWKALLGLRYDYYDQEVDDHLTNRRYGRIDREISPRVGLVYQPTTYASLYASFTKSFQPSQESLNMAANASTIEPERTVNSEVGGKFDLLGGAVTATTSLFELKRTGMKVVDPADPTKLIPVGEQRTKGFEATIAGRPADKWDFLLGYAYLDGRIAKSTARASGVLVQGNRSALTPVHTANFWLTRRFGRAFSLSGGLVYVGDQYASPSNLVVLDSYTRTDVSAGYTFGNLDLRVVVKNVFDKRYFESAHGGADLYNTPGAPRTLEVIARLRF